MTGDTDPDIRTQPYPGDMATQTFHATGLTCGHCAAAVAAEIGGLEGVDAADVTPVRDGVSTVVVTTARELTDEEVVAALEEAGDYSLVENHA